MSDVNAEIESAINGANWNDHSLDPGTSARIQRLLRRGPEEDLAHDFVFGTWLFEAVQYSEKESGNKWTSSLFGYARLFFTVPLPLLTGLGAAVGNADWLRWLTFGLSLAAALITRFLADRAYMERWILYNRYSESLFQECELYVERAGLYNPRQQNPELDDVAIKNVFVTRIMDLKSRMTDQYNQMVTSASANGTNAGSQA
jgi:hypothetical protein